MDREAFHTDIYMDRLERENEFMKLFLEGCMSPRMYKKVLKEIERIGLAESKQSKKAVK